MVFLPGRTLSKPLLLEGFYRGCCFPCGTVVIGGTLFVYYGAADKYCAVATCDFGQLLERLQKCPA